MKVKMWKGTATVTVTVTKRTERRGGSRVGAPVGAADGGVQHLDGLRLHFWYRAPVHDQSSLFKDYFSTDRTNQRHGRWQHGHLI